MRWTMLALGAATCFPSPGAAQVDAGGARPAASVTLDQLSTSSSAPATGQDRAADLEMPQPAQPSRASAITSAEVSERSEGRALGVAPVTGADRCDTAEGGEHLKLCRQRIEARAGQYARPRAAPVTPEARLLLLTNPNNNASGVNAPNGPAEQIAGALRDATAAQDAATVRAPADPAIPSGVPSSVPIIVVAPQK